MHVFDRKKLNFIFFHVPIFGYCHTRTCLHSLLQAELTRTLDLQANYFETMAQSSTILKVQCRLHDASCFIRQSLYTAFCTSYADLPLVHLVSQWYNP